MTAKSYGKFMCDIYLISKRIIIKFVWVFARSLVRIRTRHRLIHIFCTHGPHKSKTNTSDFGARRNIGARVRIRIGYNTINEANVVAPERIPVRKTMRRKMMQMVRVLALGHIDSTSHVWHMAHGSATPMDSVKSNENKLFGQKMVVRWCRCISTFDISRHECFMGIEKWKKEYHSPDTVDGRLQSRIAFDEPNEFRSRYHYTHSSIFPYKRTKSFHWILFIYLFSFYLCECVSTQRQPTATKFLRHYSMFLCSCVVRKREQFICAYTVRSYCACVRRRRQYNKSEFYWKTLNLINLNTLAMGACVSHSFSVSIRIIHRFGITNAAQQNRNRAQHINLFHLW